MMAFFALTSFIAGPLYDRIGMQGRDRHRHRR